MDYVRSLCRPFDFLAVVRSNVALRSSFFFFPPSAQTLTGSDWRVRQSPIQVILLWPLLDEEFADFQFPGDFIFDIWGAVSDGRGGRLKLLSVWKHVTYSWTKVQSVLFHRHRLSECCLNEHEKNASAMNLFFWVWPPCWNLSTLSLGVSIEITGLASLLKFSRFFTSLIWELKG